MLIELVTNRQEVQLTDRSGRQVWSGVMTKYNSRRGYVQMKLHTHGGGSLLVPIDTIGKIEIVSNAKFGGNGRKK